MKKIISKIKFFTQQNLSEDFKLVSISATENGWLGKVEVYEENAFIKTLGLDTNTKDKNLYQIELDADLNIQAFGQIQQIS